MRRSGFNVGGCWYPANYRFIAYPLSSSPHGGIHKKLPDFYQDYERERRKYEERRRRERDEEQRKKFDEFFRRFMDGGFFGYNEDEPEEKKERDYPYSVFGLKRSASDDDVKKAYRKSVLKAHPDKGGSTELFRKVREAWEHFTNYCKS